MNLSGKKEAHADNSSAAKIKSVSPCLVVITIKHIEIQGVAKKQVMFEFTDSWLL